MTTSFSKTTGLVAGTSLTHDQIRCGKLAVSTEQAKNLSKKHIKTAKIVASITKLT